LGEWGRGVSRLGLLWLGWAKTRKRLLFGRPMGIHGSDLKPEPALEIRRVGFGQTHGCKIAPKPIPVGSETRRAPEPVDPIAIPSCNLFSRHSAIKSTSACDLMAVRGLKSMLRASSSTAHLEMRPVMSRLWSLSANRKSMIAYTLYSSK
jgi:hypothetical protein